jgi:hypothetical protein
MSKEKDETWRDLLRDEREVLTRRLESLQKKSSLDALQEMLEIKNHLAKLNSEISESYNHSSSKKV